jgi:hypothetical protein
MNKKTTQSDKESASIGFKLDSEFLRALEARADALGASRHLLAKQYVILALSENEERAKLNHFIESLLREIIELRRDCALATETLLVSAGQVSEKDSRTWIAQNFRRE